MNRYAFLFLLLLPALGFSQLVNSEFGQNRIQYHKFKWKRYETPHFITFFQEKDEKVAQVALQMAEMDYLSIRKTMEYQLQTDDKAEILIYTDLTELKQTNVGTGYSDMVPSPTPNIVGNKILVHFNGNHFNLRWQVRQGIAQVLLNRILFGSNLQEIVQNAVSLNLPDWFTQGVVAYAADSWSVSQDNFLRDALLSGRYRYFSELAKDNPRLAGQSLFHYLEQAYGRATVSNLLYLTRINRDVESGFLYVMGSTLYATAANWYKYYIERYERDNRSKRFPTGGEVELPSRKSIHFTQLSISPDGKHLAWVKNDRGKYWVMLHDLESKEEQVLMKGGYRNDIQETDYNYPLLEWSPNSRSLAVVWEKKDVIRFSEFDRSTLEEKTHDLQGLDRILSLSAVKNNRWVLSATQGGFSDLYLYRRNKLDRLTFDYYDDLNPVFVRLQGKSGVIFASNRNSPQLLRKMKLDSLPQLSNFDLFYMDLDQPEKELLQLTNTPIATELQASAIDETHFSFLSNANGIQNRFIATLDTVIRHYETVYLLSDGDSVVQHADSVPLLADSLVDSSYQRPVFRTTAEFHPNTDYSRSILSQDIAYNAGKVADLFIRDGKYRLFVRDLSLERSKSFSATTYRQLSNKAYQSALRRQEQGKPAEESRVNEAPPKKEEKASEMQMEEPDFNERRADEQNNTTTEAEPTEEELERALQEELRKEQEQQRRDTLPPVVEDTTKVDIDNYFFQSEFEAVEEPSQAAEEKRENLAQERENRRENFEAEQEEERRRQRTQRPPLRLRSTDLQVVDYDPSRKTDYEPEVTISDFALRFDQEPLFWDLNQYIGDFYRFPPMTFLASTSIQDVFEDWRFDLGARTNFGFNHWEYFMTFENKKRRLDQKYIFYRKNRLDEGFVPEVIDTLASWRSVKHLAQAQFSYPFDIYRKLRVTSSLQTDNLAVLSEEFVTHQSPIRREQRLGLRAEYVFDNSVLMGVNMRKGTRYTIYADLWKPFALNTNESVQLDFSGGLTTTIGVDLRQHWGLGENTEIATRFFAATSFGQQKVLFSLGGRPNWLASPDTAKTNTSIPLPAADDFAFVTQAAPMRGFDNNIRNGGNVAVINAELRMGLFRYFRNPPRPNFFRNFQGILFFDVGTAWQGLSPFRDDNPLNSIIIDANQPGAVSPVRVRVNYFRNPIVMGYGFGMKTTVLGYWVRLDYSWGVETGVVGDPRVYFSIGTDF